MKARSSLFAHIPSRQSPGALSGVGPHGSVSLVEDSGRDGRRGCNGQSSADRDRQGDQTNLIWLL